MDTISLEKYYRNEARALKNNIAKIIKSSNNPNSRIGVETEVRTLLRYYIPTRYSISKGFIADEEGNISPEIDVIITDTHNIPPLCRFGNSKVFAASSVCAIGEITTASTKKKCREDITKLVRTRELSCVNHYMLSETPSYQMLIDHLLNNNDAEIEEKDGHLSINLRNVKRVRNNTTTLVLPPRSFYMTLGEKEPKKISTYLNRIDCTLNELEEGGSEQAWLNMAFSFTHGLFFRRPRAERWDHFSEDAFFMFIALLNNFITSKPTYPTNILRYYEKFYPLVVGADAER